MRAFLFILSLVLLPTVGLSLDKGASAQTTENRAGLVVQGPDNTTQTYCIAFEGDTISGLDLLVKSGLPLKVQAYGGMGAEVCQIGATGCDYPNQACACQSYGPNGLYWSYHHLQDNKWKASITGAGSYQVYPGDVEGWAWSDGAPRRCTHSVSFAPLPSRPLHQPNLNQPPQLHHPPSPLTHARGGQSHPCRPLLCSQLKTPHNLPPLPPSGPQRRRCRSRRCRPLQHKHPLRLQPRPQPPPVLQQAPHTHRKPHQPPLPRRSFPPLTPKVPPA